MYFWEEIDDETAKRFPIPDWMDGVGCQIEGTPIHEVLLVDVPNDWHLYKDKSYRSDAKDWIWSPAEIVFYFGDATKNIINKNIKYKWSLKNKIWTGNRINVNHEGI